MEITKDWTGNAKSVFACNGARNVAKEERQINDYYATEPRAVEALLDVETFFPYVWECACGGGHMAEVLKKRGFDVKTSDIFDYGYEGTEIIDFLQCTKNEMPRDIITNPPYKYAKEFVENALDISPQGTKIAMFLKLTFLESKARRSLFEKYPPKVVYVSSSRLQCVKNGDFGSKKAAESAVAYAWFVWEKGFRRNPVIKWIN